MLEPYPPCNWGRLGTTLFVLAETLAHRALNARALAAVFSGKAKRSGFVSQKGPRRRTSNDRVELQKRPDFVRDGKRSRAVREEFINVSLNPNLVVKMTLSRLGETLKAYSTQLFT